MPLLWYVAARRQSCWLNGNSIAGTVLSKRSEGRLPFHTRVVSANNAPRLLDGMAGWAVRGPLSSLRLGASAREARPKRWSTSDARLATCYLGSAQGCEFSDCSAAADCRHTLTSSRRPPRSPSLKNTRRGPQRLAGVREVCRLACHPLHCRQTSGPSSSDTTTLVAAFGPRRLSYTHVLAFDPWRKPISTMVHDVRDPIKLQPGGMGSLR